MEPDTEFQVHFPTQLISVAGKRQFGTGMDAKDLRIFCEMAFKYTDYNAPIERRISPSDIGRKLGLDEKTVRLRIKKMEADGFIKYYQAVPNLALFQLQSRLYSFEAPDIASKHQAIEALRETPGVVAITDFVGERFSTTLAGTSNDEIQKLAMETTKKHHLGRTFKLIDHPVIHPAITLDALDWQIIEACRYDALCPANTIAEKLSVTPRMVEYRINKLLESRALFVKAMVDFQSQKGIIFYNLALVVDEAAHSLPETLKDLHGEKMWESQPSIPLASVFAKMRIRDRFLLALMPHNGILVANMFGDTHGEAEAALMKTLKLKGVKRGNLLITKEWIEPRRPTWIDKLIEEKIASIEAPRELLADS
jgi:DNA-binding Lrp family transcriptional regulator